MDAVENLDTDTGDPELVRVAAEHGLPLVKLLHTLKLGSISLRGCSLYYYRLDRGTFVAVPSTNSNIFSVHRSDVLNSQYEAGNLNQSKYKEGRKLSK